MAPTLDHLVPKANGGLLEDDNVKLAHRICNIFRSSVPIETYGDWLHDPSIRGRFVDVVREIQIYWGERAKAKA